MYQRLIVPLDGSDLAILALPEAIMIAQHGHLPLQLVRVVDLPQLDRAGGSGLRSRAIFGRLATDEYDEYTEATTDLAATAAKLRAAGLPVTTEVRQGPVVAELLRVAQPGDLYVLATHGRSGVTRWLLGSVAEDLARRSLVPVLIVRALVPAPVAARASTPLPVPAITSQPA